MEKSQTEARRQFEKERADADFKWLMGDERGRRLVHSLLADAKVFSSAYDSGSRNPAFEIAFAEGRKQAGYKLLSRIHRLAPEMYELMIRENNG